MTHDNGRAVLGSTVTAESTKRGCNLSKLPARRDPLTASPVLCPQRALLPTQNHAENGRQPYRSCAMRGRHGQR